jgi:uncharacterized protein YjdB
MKYKYVIVIFLISIWLCSAGYSNVIKTQKVGPSLLLLTDNSPKPSRLTKQINNVPQVQQLEKYQPVSIVLVSKSELPAFKQFFATLDGDIVDAREHLVFARIRLEDIETIVQHPSVKSIDLPQKPIPLSPLKRNGFGYGDIVGQSIELVGLDLLHKQGVTGKGVKVAVVDIGFKDVDDFIAAGELPANLTKNYNTNTTSDFEGTNTHGSDVAEVLMNGAPESELHLYRITQAIDLIWLKDELLSENIKILVMSLGFFSSSFYDGTGTVNDIFTDIRNAGILPVVSAGNNAYRHWYGRWEDKNNDSVLDFENNMSIRQDSLKVLFGSTAYIVWNQFSNPQTDFDLLLFDKLGNLIGGDTARSVSFGFQPISVPDSGSILIKHISGPTENVFFHFFLSGGEIGPSNRVTSRSLLDPASNPEVLSVGAVNSDKWNTRPEELAFFSSRGPNSNGTTLPHIVAPQGDLGFFGTPNFGTSFSAPLVGSIATLFLQQNPGASATDLFNMITASVEDVGDTGKDNVFGSGFTIALQIDSINTLLTDSLLIGNSAQAKTTVFTTGVIDSSTSVVWSSVNPNVATLDSLGIVQAIAQGDADIIAMSLLDSSVTDTITISIYSLDIQVNITITENTLTVGNSMQATVQHLSANQEITDKVIWSSTPSSIASVDSTGFIMGLDVGDVTIIATSTVDSSVADTIVLSIIDVQLSIAIEQDTLIVGDSTQLSVQHQNGNQNIENGVLWSSTQSTVASVDSTGLVKGLTMGSTVVIATSNIDASHADSIFIEVVDKPTKLSIDAGNTYTIDVYDIKGTYLGRTQSHSTTWDGRIEQTAFPAGIYFIRVNKSSIYSTVRLP